MARASGPPGRRPMLRAHSWGWSIRCSPRPPAPVASVSPVAEVPVPPTIPPGLRAEIQAPQPGDLVGRSFGVQVLAPGADQVDVFLEPDRDNGGRLAGSASSSPELAKPSLLA